MSTWSAVRTSRRRGVDRVENRLHHFRAAGVVGEGHEFTIFDGVEDQTEMVDSIDRDEVGVVAVGLECISCVLGLPCRTDIIVTPGYENHIGVLMPPSEPCGVEGECLIFELVVTSSNAHDHVWQRYRRWTRREVAAALRPEHVVALVSMPVALATVGDVDAFVAVSVDSLDEHPGMTSSSAMVNGTIVPIMVPPSQGPGFPLLLMDSPFI